MGGPGSTAATRPRQQPVTVLDAYAVLAYLRDEPAAAEVEHLLRGPSLLSAVNAAEVVDQLVRVYRRDADDAHTDLALLSYAGMVVEPVSAQVGLHAGRLRARHYHRDERPVSLADCVAAATALAQRRPLATADAALAGVVRAERGELLALPDSRGSRP
jgi:PIN domain nuclease of toxin-antitoxin system